MDFETLDAKGYSLLDSDAYQERRALVVGLATSMPEEATEEQIRSIDAELDIIASEDTRRDKIVTLRNHKAAQVIAGAGDPITATKEQAEEPKLLRAASLGERVVEEMQTRGFRQGERFNLSNVSFRAGEDATPTTPSTTTTIGNNLNPALTSDYGEDTLDEVNTDIRIGYRQPMTIEQLFGREVTAKDAVSFYVEGTVTGSPAMTAEAGEYSKLSFGAPTKKTNSIKKITAYWKNSDELMSDSPRLVSHINARAPYLMDLEKEKQLLSGAGTGENITGLLNTSGITTATVTGIDLDLVDALLDYRNTITKATPNFTVDALVVSDDDYAELMKLKDKNDQYLLGGPTNMIYGNGASVTPVLWNTIRVVPTPALTKGTLVLGAFKRGATVINHASGRRFEMNYDGEDFTHGLVTFRTSERFTLAVEYPAAFAKLTVTKS